MKASKALLSLALLANCPSGLAAQDNWTHSVVQLGYEDKQIVGGIYSAGESFFAMITCSPTSPAVHVEMGFPMDIPFDVDADQFFLRSGGFAYYLPFVATREFQGFLQVYVPWGRAALPWGGQERFVQGLIDGNEIEVWAAPAQKLGEGRQVLTMPGAADGQAFIDMQQTCSASAEAQSLPKRTFGGEELPRN